MSEVPLYVTRKHTFAPLTHAPPSPHASSSFAVKNLVLSLACFIFVTPPSFTPSPARLTAALAPAAFPLAAAGAFFAGAGAASAEPPCNALCAGLAVWCTGGLDVIRKEAWSFYRTISGVRLCWELEEPEGPKGIQGYLAHTKTPTSLGPP